ncbi:UPF0256 protein [Marmoricola endophyticus]|uniref:UPF0256 protein n=1 Tax=Marmoricola endophyticus TaxID=2040280 RepID=A0A917F1X8_9ACTN|nr:GNAT family N-acetyltransferase [Marmoricola endophyticus]GGF36780.1 UPF0256 protein [Marmoricola endophyticus]
MTEEQLRFETLDPHTDDEESQALLAGYADCFAQAFFSGRMSESQRAVWLDGCRADDALLRAAYDDSGTLRPAGAPVATYSSWRGEINVGAGRTLPLHLVSDVTVEPTHRRRGLLRRLMTEDLSEAAARGLPLAALTASEATIYGRYGFAAATRERRVQVDTGPRFALRRPGVAGTIEVLDPTTAYDAVRAVDQAVLARTRGAVAKPSFYAAGDSGRLDWDTDGPERRARVAVLLDDAGSPSGYVRFVPKDLDDRPGGMAHVQQLAATDDAGYLQLWEFVARLDLVHHATATIRVDDLLDVALADHRVVRTERVRDQLWLRVLDPVAALGARPWREDGEVVLDVEDRLDLAAGRLRVCTRSGTATVTPVADEPDVRLDVETLAAVYLGDRTVTELAAAGRITGPAVERFAAMADHAGPAPWNTTDF